MELSKLNQFMLEVSHSGKSEYSGAYKQIPLRLRFISNSKLVALSGILNGASKNKILNDLIEIALDQVYEKMSKDQKALFDELQSGALAGSFINLESGDEKDD